MESTDTMATPEAQTTGLSPSTSSNGYADASDVEMMLALRAADEMARVCDDWVKRGIIGSRSALADARLNYGEPYKYKWSPRRHNG